AVLLDHFDVVVGAGAVRAGKGAVRRPWIRVGIDPLERRAGSVLVRVDGMDDAAVADDVDLRDRGRGGDGDAEAGVLADLRGGELAAHRLVVEVEVERDGFAGGAVGAAGVEGVEHGGGSDVVDPDGGPAAAELVE